MTLGIGLGIGFAGSAGPTYFVVADGNSLTYGFGASDPTTQSYPATVAGMRGARVYNDGSIGATAGTMYTEFLANIGPYGLMSDEKVYIAFEVINEIALGDTTGNVQRLKQLWQRARYWGFKVIAGTSFPTANFDATQETNRLAANAVITSDWATCADVLCDLNAIPQFTPPGSVANPTHFADHTHLNATGYAVLGAYISPYIDTARAATVADYPTVIAGNSASAELYDIQPTYLVDRPSGVSQIWGGWDACHLLQSTVGFRPAYNATGWNSAKPVVSFDGTTKFMTCTTGAAPTSINGTDHAWTIAATVRFAANDVAVIGWDHTGTSAYTTLGTNGAGRTRIFRRDTAGNVATYVGSAVLGTSASSRHRLVATYDGTSVRIYVDGVLDATIAKSAPTTGSASIGAMTFNRIMFSSLTGSAFMNGEVAGAFLGTSAWSAAQVTRDYTYQKATMGGLP